MEFEGLKWSIAAVLCGNDRYWTRGDCVEGGVVESEGQTCQADMGQEKKWYSHEKVMQYCAAAKSLQSCPTLCDPIDSSPPGSPVPGILQARVLEWGAIAFSKYCARTEQRVKATFFLFLLGFVCLLALSNNNTALTCTFSIFPKKMCNSSDTSLVKQLT